ncbi:MAG: phage integrase N-terminal SAM-like domain-containing protein, partial [Nanoarchaeota archaeon]|nr:phage integrase N-terminal SAM-like domain-containing protein [Nanoarchaeota archaeon]
MWHQEPNGLEYDNLSASPVRQCKSEFEMCVLECTKGKYWIGKMAQFNEESARFVQKKLKTELSIQGKSPKTIRNYTFYNKDLLIYTKKAHSEIDTDDIKDYLAYLMT